MNTEYIYGSSLIRIHADKIHFKCHSDRPLKNGLDLHGKEPVLQVINCV
jgi:hypothetical protein